MLTRRTDLNDSVFLWWKMHNTSCLYYIKLTQKICSYFFALSNNPQQLIMLMQDVSCSVFVPVFPLPTK